MDEVNAHLKEGRIADAASALMEAVRSKPEDAGLRVSLFQLCCLTGNYERARNQIEVASKLDSKHLMLEKAYLPLIELEIEREQVAAGKKNPTILGEPEDWMAAHVKGAELAFQGEMEAAAALFAESQRGRSASAGTVNGTAFEGIADADDRFGPFLEVYLNQEYYWVPFSRLKRLASKPPQDMLDLLWMPADLVFSNEGELAAHLVCRYPGSDKSDDGQILLSRAADWQEPHAGVFTGMGVKTCRVDDKFVPLPEVRELVVGNAA